MMDLSEPVANNVAMRPLQIKQLDYDLTATSGLALVGHHLKTLEPLFKRIDKALPVRTGVATSDVLRSYLGLLVQGKSDFDAIDNLRGDTFYKHALGISLLPSSPTMRQRLDAKATELFHCVPEMIEGLLGSARPEYGTLPCGWLPLDIDTFAMDNGKTVKDGVGRTYTGVDGYCPLAAYLGSNGYCLDLALRPGTQHSKLETDFNFEWVVPMAQRLSAQGPKAPILVRLDSGFDAADLMQALDGYNHRGLPRVDWLIKWNRRSTDVAQTLVQLEADETVRWQHPRPGKRVALWEQAVQLEGVKRPVRRVLRMTERTITAKGQALILPELVLEGWTTSLPKGQFPPSKIIALYEDHGTHEQFHSEFKTDLDLERLPSGKFDTNYLVCALAALAMNILRLMGQAGLHGPDTPVRHPAKRRRLKTVMQELVYRAGRLIRSGGQLILGLGANDRAADAFIRLHRQLAGASG
jgi:Transposase DDE domain group 1